MKKWITLFLSYVLISFGVSIQITVSYIGVEPWTALHESLAMRWLTIGAWTVILQAVFLVLTYLGERKLPRIGTFINMLIMGPLIDFFLWLDFQSITNVFAYDLLLYACAVTFTSFGMSLAIFSNMGPGSKTQFCVMLHTQFGWRLSYAKYMMEGLALVGSLLLGGNIFIGTLLYVLLSPYLIERFLWRIERLDAKHQV